MSGMNVESGESRSRVNPFVVCLLPALAMSYGWGFRGDFGHEAGAMVPGALLGMGVCLASGRASWANRSLICGFLGAVGWGLGGQVSYGMITSYTVSYSFPDTFGGYAYLWVIGAVWGGVGAACLALGLTRPRSELESLVGPTLAVGALWLVIWEALVWIEPLREANNELSYYTLHDSDWLQAVSALIAVGGYAFWAKGKQADLRGAKLIAALSVGWMVGYVFFVWVLDWHMQPKDDGFQRSDNWAGMLGLLGALAWWHFRNRDFAGLKLTAYGLIGGGIGFSVGNLINIPDKVQWPPFYNLVWLRGFDHWKWTEQSFGFMMGLAVGIGVWRLLRLGIASPEEDVDGEASSRKSFMTLNELSVAFMFVAMLYWYINQTVHKWGELKYFNEDLMFGMSFEFWYSFLVYPLLALMLIAIFRNRRTEVPILPSTIQGRGQLSFLSLMWITELLVLMKAHPLTGKGIFFVHGSFWLTCMIATWVLFFTPVASRETDEVSTRGSDDRGWISLWKFAVVCLLMPVLLWGVTVLTLAMQDKPNEGSRIRFGDEAWHIVNFKGRE